MRHNIRSPNSAKLKVNLDISTLSSVYLPLSHPPHLTQILLNFPCFSPSFHCYSNSLVLAIIIFLPEPLKVPNILSFSNVTCLPPVCFFKLTG